MAITGDNDSTRNPELSEVIWRHVRAELAEGMHTMIVARVERYDASKQQVDCKPLIRDFHRDESGALVVDSVPVVTSVPVCFFTAGGFTFTLPIVAGETTGMLLFAERSLDRWLSGSGGEVDPRLYQRFSLSDAVFMPGVLSFGAPMSGNNAPPTDHATAGSVTGKRIHFRESTITIGDEAGSKAIGLHGDSVAATATQATWIANVTTFINGLVPGTLTPPVGFGTLTASATQAKAK